MVSKNVLAVLIILVIVVSVVGTTLMVTDFGGGQETGKANVKLNVVENPKSTAAVVKLNVIEKGG